MSRNLTIARPYAKAIFALAKQENAFSSWASMLEQAAAVVNDSQLQQLMKNPRFSTPQLIQLVVEVGQNFNPAMQHLIALLARFKRLALLSEIKELFDKYCKEAERVINVELIAAFDMQEKEIQRFKEALMRRLGCNITLQCTTDKKILGGAIIRAGDVVIDGSARGKLATLSEAVGIS